MLFTRYLPPFAYACHERGNRCSVWHGMQGAPGTAQRTILHPPRAPRTHRVRVHATATQDDLYQALGIARDATKAQIKAAYRRAVRDCHPDVNPSLTAAQRFQLVQEAYDVLLDDRARRRYNLHLDSTQRRGNASSQQKGGQQQKPIQGRDVHAVVGLHFLEAVRGTQKMVSVMVMDVCPTCQGDQDHPTRSTNACDLCHGGGEVLTKRVGMVNGQLSNESMWRPCPACGGGGDSMRQYCSRCAGQGWARVAKGVRVTFPAGVDSGHVLRMRGHGDRGRYGGSNGDAYIAVKVHDDAHFWRKGNDLYSPLSICFTDAILGATMTVSTVWGARTLVVPPGTQHGALLPVAGAGARRVVPGGLSAASSMDDGSDAEVDRGQHFFKVVVQVPQLGMLSAQELVQLQSLQALSATD